MTRSQASLPGPEDITRVVLPNGITVLARANFNSPSVVFSGYLEAGSLLEPPEKCGLGDFTALSLMRGTEQHAFQEIFDTLESVGAGLGFQGGTHTLGFSGRSLAEDLNMLLGLLSETLRRPLFPPEHVERLRTQILTGLAIRAQDTSEMASMAFDEIVYAGHPYSRPDDGYPETVQRITRADLVEFHRTSYGPAGLVIAVVGAVDPQSAVDRVAAALGDWVNPDQRPTPPLPAVTPLTHTVRRKVDLPGKSQVDLLMGTIGPLRRSPDFLAASLGNSVLGQFGMFGRIGEVVREREGLAYYAYSSLSGGLGPGPWYISAGVDRANVEKTIGILLAELKRFTSEPVTEGELEDSKANYIGRLPLSLESNGGVSGALLNLERYKLGLDYYHHYNQMISAVTREQALAAAQHYLDPERLAIAAAG